MENYKKKYLKIGVIVMIGIILLIFGVSQISRTFGKSNGNENIIYINSIDAYGVAEAYLNGIRIEDLTVDAILDMMEIKLDNEFINQYATNKLVNGSEIKNAFLNASVTTAGLDNIHIEYINGSEELMKTAIFRGSTNNINYYHNIDSAQFDYHIELVISVIDENGKINYELKEINFKQFKR